MNIEFGAFERNIGAKCDNKLMKQFLFHSEIDFCWMQH